MSTDPHVQWVMQGIIHIQTVIVVLPLPQHTAANLNSIAPVMWAKETKPLFVLSNIVVAKRFKFKKQRYKDKNIPRFMSHNAEPGPAAARTSEKVGRLHSPHRKQAKLSLGGLTLHCPDAFVHNSYPDSLVLLCHVDSDLLIFCCLSCVELQAYFVSRALVHFTSFPLFFCPFLHFRREPKGDYFGG